jgi:hypothetical protein
MVKPCFSQQMTAFFEASRVPIIFHHQQHQLTGGKIYCLLSLIPANLQTVSLTCKYLREFSKNFEMTEILFSGAWWKLIHKKTLSKISHDTVPLSQDHEKCIL